MDTISSERLLNSLILVVDDVELNRKMLTHSLQGAGYTNVVVAEDGSQALQITHELRPDLVILDLMMPTMDGYAYCTAIRQNKSYDSMPILVQTALDDMDKKLRAFQLGASDYICKPVDPGELIARTRVHLMNKHLLEDLQLYRKRVMAELDSAKIMQTRLMPSAQQIQMCERVYDMKIGSKFETCSHLGGDCWGMRPLSDNRIAIWIYDFSGHGMAAAMNVFRMHTIMQEFMHSGGEPGNFLTTLNRHLHPLLERDEFATMFYGIIDTDANCLLYASAAVQPSILFTRREESPVSLSGRGFPLGVIPNATYDTKYTPFTHGDLLVLYSDCIIESPNGKGEFITEDMLKETIVASMSEQQLNPAKHALDILMQQFKTHHPAPPIDDITMTAYYRLPKD